MVCRCFALQVSCCFSYRALNTGSLLCIFDILTIRCHGEVLSWTCLFEVQNVICVWTFVSSSGLGEFSVLMLLNGFPVPLVFTSLVPWVLGFGLGHCGHDHLRFAYWYLYVLFPTPSPSWYSFFCFESIVHASHYVLLALFFHLQPFCPFSVSLLKFSLILLNFFISLAAFFFCIDDFLCRSCIGLIFPLSNHFQAIDQFFLQENFEMKYSSDILPISEYCLPF